MMKPTDGRWFQVNMLHNSGISKAYRDWDYFIRSFGFSMGENSKYIFFYIFSYFFKDFVFLIPP